MESTLIQNPILPGKEKEAIEFLFSNCFKSGFGTLSKSEIDLILFTTILKYSSHSNKTDYSLSKYLQITQNRIRSLKEKVSVKYLSISKEEAINIFVKNSEFAKIEDKYIDIPINDIAMKNELEAILDDKNILMHYQLNPKIFRIRIDDFLELIIQFELINSTGKKESDIEKRIINALKKIASSNEEVMKKVTCDGSSMADLTKTTLKESLVKGGIAFGVDLIASLVPGGAFLSEPVKKLLLNIKDKI